MSFHAIGQRGRRSSARRVLVSVVLLVAATLSGPVALAAAPQALELTPCADGFECATVTVPWDHADPTSGTLAIPIVRHRATGPGERIGALFFNPGGPGIPGVETLIALVDAFPAVLKERFDLVSFDPRGTGGAARIDCGTDVAGMFALDQAAGPDGAAAHAWRDIAAACEDVLGKRMASYSTAATAEDVDVIRQALGEDTISWLGLSYGTRLGLEYLRRHPDRVRAIVLDGPMDPSAPLDQQARDMAAAAEAGVDRLLALCVWQDPCPLGDDPIATYDEVAGALASMMTAPPADGPEVGPATLQSAAQSAAMIPFFFAEGFANALAAARDGTYDPLIAAGPGGSTDGQGNQTFDAQWVILCNDEAEHGDAASAAALATELAASAPRVGQGVSAGWGVGCQAMPDAIAPVEPFAMPATAPVLIVGSTGDPSTSYVWAERMADAVEGSTLLTRDGDGHTAFFNTFYTGCVGASVSAFLVDPDAASPPASCTD